MRCIGQGLESLKTFCAVMSLPNPVKQKSHDVINNKLSRVMKEVAEESMKMAAVEEYSSSPDNLLTVSGDGTWKTRGHSSLIGVCTVIGAETALMMNRYTGFVLQIQIHGVKYNAAINNNLQNYKHKPSVAKAVQDVIKPVFADLSHPALLKKCLGGKTQNPNESLNSLIWKFCPKTIGSRLQIAEIAANLETSVFNDGNQILISILEKFGLKINRNVCVSLAERDNRRIFMSRQRCLQSSFEARRAKKIKKKKKFSCFRNRKLGLGSNREGIGVCQCIVSLWHACTLNSRGAASPLVRLLERKRYDSRPLPPPDCSPAKLGRNRGKSYCHLYGAHNYG
ncbi:uncharacterized protein TNCV_4878241 [Trichonephila clavipes]|nr:uncharacterized protein TNCV_4878241 [Trichonephila clavipes]